MEKVGASFYNNSTKNTQKEEKKEKKKRENGKSGMYRRIIGRFGIRVV
jgi:hypothetical protein